MRTWGYGQKPLDYNTSCFKGSFSTRVKILKIRVLTRIVSAIVEYGINETKKMELREGDSLEVSAHTPTLNPN